MSTRTVRLDDEAEKTLERLRNVTVHGYFCGLAARDLTTNLCKPSIL